MAKKPKKKTEDGAPNKWQCNACDATWSYTDDTVPTQCINCESEDIVKVEITTTHDAESSEPVWVCSGCGEETGVEMTLGECPKCRGTDFMRLISEEPKASKTKAGKGKDKPAPAEEPKDELPQSQQDMIARTLDELQVVAEKVNSAISDHEKKKAAAKVAKDRLEALQDEEHNLVMRLGQIRDGSYLPLFVENEEPSEDVEAGGPRQEYKCSDKECGQTWTGGPGDDTCPTCKQAAEALPEIDDDNLLAAKRHFQGRAKKGKGGTVTTVAQYVYGSKKKDMIEAAQRLCDQLAADGDVEASVEDGKVTYMAVDKDAEVK